MIFRSNFKNTNLIKTGGIFTASFGALLLSIIGVAHAGEADIVDARAHLNADGTFRIEASVSHDDTGWEHYADGFDIVAPDGTVLATRVLAHPHVGENPFTRSASKVDVPEGVETVIVRAHDLVHGYGGVEFTLELPRK